MKKTIRYFFIGMVLCFHASAQFSYENAPASTPAAGSPITSIPYLDYPGGISLYNCIRTWAPARPITDPTNLTSASMTHNDASVNVDYFDGFGRPIQSISNYGVLTPLGKDWVTVHTYNSNGGKSNIPIPFPADDANGKFKTNAEALLVSKSQAKYPGQWPYTYIQDDESPLRRPKLTRRPGKPDLPFLYNSKQLYYWTNDVNEVFDIRIVDGITTTPLVATGYYPAQTLEKTVNIDEDNKVTVTYKDKFDRIILTKTEVASNNGNSNHHANWSCTYYVYDEMNRLRCVVPPLAINNMFGTAMPALPYSITNTEIADLAFSYNYDGRGRLIQKKVPGKEIEYYVYDIKDRMVFWQDGNLRTSGPYAKWGFILYDAQDREYATGIYKPNENLGADVINMHTTGIYTPAANTIFSYVRGYDYFQKPFATITDCEVLTWTVYDHYDYSPNFTIASTTFDMTSQSLLTGTAPQSILPVATNNLRGLPTGKLVKIMDASGAYIKSELFYDIQGRLIQEKKTNNATLEKDINTTQYNFKNEMVSTAHQHENPAAIAPPGFINPNLYKNTTIVKTYEKNGIDKPKSIKQKINNGTEYMISNLVYDEFNRISAKQMPATGENYEYDIKNQLTSINKDHALNGQIPGGVPKFGEILSYETGFSIPNYNGNISGAIWRGPGVGSKQRFYGYKYDKLNRLTQAEFGEKTAIAVPISGGFMVMNIYTPFNLDYSVPNIAYDYNGNITHMDQRGTVIGGSPFDMDKLQYAYNAKSNRLFSVHDIGNNTTDLPDFKNLNTTTGVLEYDYDANGNVKIDKNRGINTPITYDHNNKPTNIVVSGKGNIQYVYDALGNKLKKIVTDNLSGTTNTYHYYGPFLYKNNELQHIAHDEGRCRPKTDPNQSVAEYTYDYFTKDHLGNVRATIELIETGFTLGGGGMTHPGQVYMATHELSVHNVENLVWDNIDDVWAAKPASMTPNDVMAAELDGSDPSKKIGTAIMIRVMPGDQFEVGSDTYYEDAYDATPAMPAQPLLQSLLTSLMGGNMYDGSAAAENPSNLNIINNTLNSPQAQSFYNDMVMMNSDPAKPKAYLSYLVFDENFQLVPANSGVLQVNGAPNSWGQIGTPGTIQIGQAGYLTVFIGSNDMNKVVYFDKVKLINYSGSVLEEDHYYPFGLTLTTQPVMASNRNYIKYNSKELQRDEFKSPTLGKSYGLEMYDYGARMYDPQIGRWNHVDPIADKMPVWSPYSYSFNNPVYFIDPDGKEPTPAEAVRMAAHVYGDKKDNILIGGWRVSARDFGVTLNTNAGLKSLIYERVVDGKVSEYAYVTAGTQTSQDWKENGKQPLGLSKEYEQSASNAIKLSVALSDKELNFIGHSQGGGEAALNSLVTSDANLIGRKAFTFNAAGVSNVTKFAEGTWKTPLKSEKNIEAYILRTDPLNKLQNNSPLMPDVNGNRHYLWPKDLSSIYNGHSINNIMKNFGVSNPEVYSN